MDFEKLLSFIGSPDEVLRNHYRSIRDTDKQVLARTVKLNEDVGELCNEVLDVLSLQRGSKLADQS